MQVAGNSFTWDDYYRLETEDHSFQVSLLVPGLKLKRASSSPSSGLPQDVIDTLLNNAVFTYLGALIPWGEMTNEEFGEPLI